MKKLKKGWEARPNTKWFNKKNAESVKKKLENKGKKAKIVITTKINPLSNKKNKAYLVKIIKK